MFIRKWGPHVICKMFQQLGCPHQVIWELSLWARCIVLLLGGYSAESKVVYHLPKFSGKSSWKVNGTRLFGSFHREISGSSGTSGKVVLFFRMVYSQQKSMFHLLKAIFDTGFRSSQLFFGKWNWFVQIVNAIPEWCPELRLTLFCPSGEQPIAQDRFQLAVICTDVTTSRPIKTLETINNFNDNVCYVRVCASWAPQGEGQSMTRPLQTGPLSSCTNQCGGECVMLFWKNDLLLHIVGLEDDVVMYFQDQHKIGSLSNKGGDGNDQYSIIFPRVE